jgi:CheY-like chemotaxis protein
MLDRRRRWGEIVMGAQRVEREQRPEVTRDRQTARLVQALETVAADAVRRHVLSGALDLAGLSDVPTRVEDLTFFVSGPLYEAAHQLLGDSFAEALLIEVAPILDRAWDDDRKTTTVPPAMRSPAQHSDLVSSAGPAEASPAEASPAEASPAEANPAEANASPVSANPTSSVVEKARTYSAVQRVLPEGDEAEKADTIPAPDEALRAHGIPLPPTSNPGDAAVTIPGPESDYHEAMAIDGAGFDGIGFDGIGFDGIGFDGTAVDTTSVERHRTHDETPPPPRSHRLTVPYLQSVLTPPRRRRRIMIVHSQDAPRRELAELLEKRGYAVVTAHDVDVARALHQRLAPTLIIAEIETLAPDFEPIALALDALLGENADAEPPHLIVLGDGASRSIPPGIDCIVEPPALAEHVLHQVQHLLPIESQRAL